MYIRWEWEQEDCVMGAWRRNLLCASIIFAVHRQFCANSFVSHQKIYINFHHHRHITSQYIFIYAYNRDWNEWVVKSANVLNKSDEFEPIFCKPGCILGADSHQFHVHGRQQYIKALKILIRNHSKSLQLLLPQQAAISNPDPHSGCIIALTIPTI